MLITILTAGTRGDTQPYVALGKALVETGYRVRIATFKNYESFVRSFGLEFYPVRGDISRVVSGESAMSAHKADNPLKFFLSFNQLKSLVVDLQKDFYDACENSDAIIYHPGISIGYFLSKHLRIPGIMAAPFPMTPTKAYPSLIFYDSVRLGGVYNLATHKITEQIMWFASSSAIRQFWKKQFGYLPKDFGCPYGKQTTNISCSNHVFPRPADWPKHVYNTGYWFLDEETDWKPSNALLDFLQKGNPPIYVGFGSLGDPALAEQTTRLVIEALRLCGQRGILATGWSGMAQIDEIPQDIFMLESAPHAWLFPRMAAVVHHGGAGTTAAGLRAGVPGLVIPHSNDHFAWGRRIHELGVGAKPVPRKDLTAKNLSQAIRSALSKEIVDTARDLGARIRGENGAQRAAEIITSLISG